MMQNTGGDRATNGETVANSQHISNEQRLAFVGQYLGTQFYTESPRDYGWNSGNSMQVTLRESLDGESGKYTMVYYYDSQSDSKRRVDFHISETGDLIAPDYSKPLGFQEHHYKDCLPFFDALVLGKLIPAEVCSLKSLLNKESAKI